MQESQPIQNVLITGGAGYVGCRTVPKLLAAGYHARVLDLFIYGENGFPPELSTHPGFSKIKGDIRDRDIVDKALQGIDAVIHLACISNDPSYELNPQLGRSINHESFLPLVNLAKNHEVKRFIYASSSSVYGIKKEPAVTEDLSLEPLTDYSKYKALCEQELLSEGGEKMVSVIFRPATVCGYSPRLRLDLTVNTLTNHAINKGEILVFGGSQQRPNIHIEDMSDLYVQSLGWPSKKIHNKIFNVGYNNMSVENIAILIQEEIGQQIIIRKTPTDDNRSYHVSSEKIARELGFKPKYTVRDAVRDLKRAFALGWIPNPMTNTFYYNVKRMQELKLQ